MLTNGVVLYHDNTQHYMAAETTEMIQKLKFKFLAHPAYSPHLAQSDYHIRPLKAVLHRLQFANDEEIKDVVHMLLYAQLETFFTYGIMNLMGQSNKCMKKLQNYAEKLWYICFYVPFAE
jgi:histone-lysine N-methyltransferase SETMAR